MAAAASRGGTLNGQTVNFTYPAGVTSLEQWAQALAAAYSQVDGNPSQANHRLRC